MKSIAVYCGSNTGNDVRYRHAASDVGKYLAKHDVRIVYGAGRVGLMGVMADAALKHSGEVIGVIPEVIKAHEVYRKGLTKLYTVRTMHQRKQIIFDLSDGFIALPGGFGTLDELFEIATWGQLMLHKKPIGMLNVNGFYNSLLKHFDRMVLEGFLKQENRELIVVADNIKELYRKMKTYNSVAVEKWHNKMG